MCNQVIQIYKHSLTLFRLYLFKSFHFKNGTNQVSQIRFILLQNRRGRTRLSKWFVNYDENEKLRLQSEIHRMIVGRDSKQTDFIEVFQANLVS